MHTTGTADDMAHVFATIGAKFLDMISSWPYKARVVEGLLSANVKSVEFDHEMHKNLMSKQVHLLADINADTLNTEFAWSRSSA